MLGKKAGHLFAKDLHESGVLEKIAVAAYAPVMEKYASMMAGQAVASLEKQGAISSQEDTVALANIYAGQIIANLEKQGKIKFVKKAKKGKKGKAISQNKISKREIIKKASEATAESVLQDLFKTDMGSNVNKKLGKLLNP